MKGREYVYLPSFEMCRVTSEPCRILYDTDFFPPNLKCDRKIWSCDNCRNDVREVKFNAMGQCMAPLIPTESSINHYPGKLGLKIKNILFYWDLRILNCQQLPDPVFIRNFSIN